jgi:hypothetical protein
MGPLFLAVSCQAAFAAATPASDDWKMLSAYPSHGVATELGPKETITIDGRLDEPA